MSWFTHVYVKFFGSIFIFICQRSFELIFTAPICHAFIWLNVFMCFIYTCFWIKVNVKCNWKFKIWNWKCFAPVTLLIDRNIHANLNLGQGLYLVTFLRGRALVLIILFVNGCWSIFKNDFYAFYHWFPSLKYTKCDVGLRYKKRGVTLDATCFSQILLIIRKLK